MDQVAANSLNPLVVLDLLDNQRGSQIVVAIAGQTLLIG